MTKKKLYIVSGLGADFKVLERLSFPEHLEIVFLEWLIPEPGEPFSVYVHRMAAFIDDSEPFYLMGYSFGGIIVQEIHQLKPAEKVVILGSIKSAKEKSRMMKLGRITRIPKLIPASFYTPRTMSAYSYLRKFFTEKNTKILQYFNVRHPYYLKWSIAQVVEWNGTEIPGVIQILADRDIVFPVTNSKPDYIIKGGSHLFPATRHKEVSLILEKIFQPEQQASALTNNSTKIQ